MTNNKEIYILDSETDIQFEESRLTEEEWNWLGELISGSSSSGGDIEGERHVDRVSFETSKLAQIAFEYDLLSDVANTVEIEVLRTFHQSEDRTLTTGEISEQIDRPKSSVSRALARLVEKGSLEKVQRGVYRSRTNR